MNAPNRNQPPAQGGGRPQNNQGGGGQGQQGQGGGRRRKRRRGGGGGGPKGPGGPQQQQPQAQGGAPNQPRPQQPQQGGKRHGKGGQHKGQGHGGQQKGGNNRPQQRQDAKPSKPIRLQPEFKEIPNKHEIKRYGVIFYETLAAAKADLEQITAQAAGYDQLNIIVRAEANMDDPDFSQLSKVKLFAGTAWALIHERRKEEGWYDAPR